MYTETKKAFEGTTHADIFFFYHDALALMTAKETKQWMNEQGILKHWILPELGLNKGTRYEDRVPGNAPEFNALDSNCNRDIHCAVLEHVSYTAALDQTNDSKFSVSTPNRQDSAYLRLWDPELQRSHPMGVEAGVPSSRRILEDMDRIVSYSIKKRFEVRGVVVNGCGTRRGRRYDGVRTVGKWGGRREKKSFVATFIHPDAEGALAASLSFSQALWEGN